MKLRNSPGIGVNDPVLQREMREMALQVNQLSEGRIRAYYQAKTSIPTAGDHAQGDVVLNAEPQELGAIGSKYVLHGWQCVVSGSPGTWVEMRYLTGN